MKTLVVIISCLASASLFAHPLFENTEVPAGVAFKAEMMITHGCGDSPTVRLIVEVPPEVLAVTPQLKSGWTIEKSESSLEIGRAHV